MEEKTEISLTAGYHRINSREVDLFLHPDSDPGSSKPQSTSVKSQTVTKFTWPKSYYIGSLITVSSKFIAYVIRGKSDAVRILNRLTASRVLLKGFQGPVCDVVFAHANSSLFAAIDESGSLFIYSIEQPDGVKAIQHRLLMHIEKRNTIKNPSHRVVWSPHIHHPKDPGEPELIAETSYLAATSMDTIEMYKLHSIIPDSVTNNGVVRKTDEDLDNGFSGFVRFEAHCDIITDVSIAPDGAVLCTASEDGYVRFWETSGITEDRTEIPKILHEWYPHDKSSVSCIKFLDNYQVSDPDIPYWRFLLTAARQTQQIKIWCTVKWNCLQTISFNMTEQIPRSNYSIPPQMKLSVDQTGNYIMITDINRRVVYCLECCSEFDATPNGDGDCTIRSINVCLIDTPVLSFHMSAVKEITMMSAEEPPRRRRGVQIQSFTLHQTNLYKLQSRILHHKSFLSEVPNSGGGTPSGLLSPRVLSPTLLSGDEQIYSPKLRLSDSEEPKKRSRSKTPSRGTKSKSPARMSQGTDVSEKKSPGREEPSSEMTSLMEKLKSQSRRQSNSSTSTNGAIESTSGLQLDSPNGKSSPHGAATEIPVSFASDDDPGKSTGSGKSDQEETGQKPTILDKLFGAPKEPALVAEEKIDPVPEKAPSLLESIFSQASKKGKGLVTMDTESTLTNVTPLNPGEADIEPELTLNDEPDDPMKAMTQLLESLKMQTENKIKTPDIPEQVQQPEVPQPEVLTPRPISVSTPSTSNKVALIFGDQLIDGLDKVLDDKYKFSIEIHMLDGALTRNIQKYMTEMGTRKDAEVVIFHVGTNDVSSKRSESQFNTDLMLLFGAARSSFPNAKLCASSILPRQDEFASKVAKFNAEAEKQCEVCAVDLLSNTKIFSDIESYSYKNDPTECVLLTMEGKSNLGIHFVCFIEDCLPEGGQLIAPKMIVGPKLSSKLPKDGIEVRNLTPVCEDREDKEDVEPEPKTKKYDTKQEEMPIEPRAQGDGSKKPTGDRDGRADGSQSPLPPTPTTLLPQQPPVQANSTCNSGDLQTLIMMMRKQSEEIESLRNEIRRNQRNNTETMSTLNQDIRICNKQGKSNGIAGNTSERTVIDGLLPSLHQRMCEALDRTATEKINQIRPAMREQLEKTITSPGMMMAMSKSMEQAVQRVYQTSLENETIPRFDRATKEMFLQISTAFNKGQEEYIARIEKMLDRRVKAEVSQLEGTISSAEDPNGRLALNLSANIAKTLQIQLLSEVSKQMQRTAQEQNQLMSRTFGQLRQQLIIDIQKMLDSHSSHLDVKVEDAIARAQTPAPVTVDDTADVRDQIRQLVQANKYNEAFTKALMQSNISLVVDLMESLEQDKLFSQDLPNGTCLEQNIILSLISQLAQDLRAKANIKIPYLQDALLSLNPHHPSSEHIPSVLGQLQVKIQQFLEMNPRDPSSRSYRMLNMSADSIVKDLRNYH